MPKTIEESFIEYLSPSLLLYSRRASGAHKFLCPYCQSTGRDDKGKQIAPSGASGFIYKKNNAWNFGCKRLSKCGKGHSFEKFLEIFYPLLHFEYVRQRDQLGTTGYQTNCPSLETVLKKRGVLSGQPPQLHADRKKNDAQHLQRPAVPTAAPSAHASPKVTKLPPMRSPQQQAGHQSRLNHLVKQRQQQRRKRQGW